MLTIRKSQMAVLGAVLEEAFIEEMMGLLREAYPDKTNKLDDVALRSRLTREVTAAKSLELASRADVVCYLRLGMMYGPGFIKNSEHAWMRDYLTDPDVESGQRMPRLYAAVLEKNEREKENRRVLEQFLKSGEGL
jgi:hypothetical protein